MVLLDCRDTKSLFALFVVKRELGECKRVPEDLLVIFGRREFSNHGFQLLELSSDGSAATQFQVIN